MRMFVIGGSGEFGLPIVRTLAALDEIDEVCIGARNLERAQVAAMACGTKVNAVQVDATNADALIAVIRGFDFVLNTTSEDTQATAVHAAIAAGVGYCDLMGSITTDARDELNLAAREAGVTAITGFGLGGLYNMLFVHLGKKIDEVKELQVFNLNTWVLSIRILEFLEAGADADEICKELLTERDLYGDYGSYLGGRKIDAIEYELSIPWQKPGTARALGFVEGRWQDVDPIANGERMSDQYAAWGVQFSVVDGPSSRFLVSRADDANRPAQNSA